MWHQTASRHGRPPPDCTRRLLDHQDIFTIQSTVRGHHIRIAWTNKSEARYTFSVKLSEFTVWRHTWRKKLVNCAVLTGNSARLRTPFQSSFIHIIAQFTQGIPQFPQFTCRHHDGIISRHSIHSADEHRMIYSFSNTTSCCTYYAFFSSFRITLWPMWLANSKRQPCFNPT